MRDLSQCECVGEPLGVGSIDKRVETNRLCRYDLAFVSTARVVDVWLLRKIGAGQGSESAGRTMQTLSFVAQHGALWFGLGVLLALADRRRWVAWLVMGASAPGSIGINLGFKLLVRRKRPDLESGLESSTTEGWTSYSFPSAHATSSFTAAVVASEVDRRLRFPAVLLACLISLSRVRLLKHYPADVVAGGLVGAALGRVVAYRLKTGV